MKKYCRVSGLALIDRDLVGFFPRPLLSSQSGVIAFPDRPGLARAPSDAAWPCLDQLFGGRLVSAADPRGTAA